MAFDLERPFLADTPLAPGDPVNNPDVEPAPVWTWSGFWVLVLFLLERFASDLALWQDPPRWVPYALLALPVAIRWVRTKVTGIPTSFRRQKP